MQETCTFNLTEAGAHKVLINTLPRSFPTATPVPNAAPTMVTTREASSISALASIVISHHPPFCRSGRAFAPLSLFIFRRAFTSLLFRRASRLPFHGSTLSLSRLLNTIKPQRHWQQILCSYCVHVSFTPR